MCWISLCRPIVSAMLVIAIAAMLSYTESDSPERTVEQWIAKARRAESVYHYAEALSYYQKALDIRKDDPSIQLDIAKQLIGLERLDEACDTLRNIVARHPNYSEAHTLLGIYYQKFDDDFESAQSYYQKAIEADPSFVRPRKLLGEIFITLHRYEQAYAVFEALLRIDPKTVSGNRGLGNVLIKQSKFEEAQKPLRRAIELDPRDPEPHRLLGQALGKLGKRDEARVALKRYQTLKNQQNALTERIRVVRRGPDKASNWFALGKEYLRQKQTEKAIGAFEEGVKLDPGSAVYQSLLGTLYLQNKQPVRSQHYLERAIRLDPENADNYNNLGVSFMFQRNYRQAADAFRQALEHGSRDPRIQKNLQYALRKMKEKGSPQ